MVEVAALNAFGQEADGVHPERDDQLGKEQERVPGDITGTDETHCLVAKSPKRNAPLGSHIAQSQGMRALWQAQIAFMEWERNLRVLLARGWSSIKMSAMEASSQPIEDGARCVVVAGSHRGKSGTVRDVNISKTGAVTITVVQADGERFKTLAKNVRAEG